MTHKTIATARIGTEISTDISVYIIPIVAGFNTRSLFAVTATSRLAIR